MSAIYASIFFLLAWSVTLVPVTDGNHWLLSKDLSLPEADRYNFWLVFIEVLLFTFFYFNLTTALSSFAEVKNTLPGWKELGTAAIITATLAAFIPKIETGGEITGSLEEKGFNHFTVSMQSQVFWFTLLMMIIVSLYFVYTEPLEE